MAVIGVSAWTAFGEELGDDGPRNQVLTNAACSDSAQDLCLDTVIDYLKPDAASVFAIQAQRDGAADTAMAAESATATPAPQPAPEPEPAEEPTEYASMTVREGDTLLDLATWFGVSPFDIAAFNGIAVDDWLYIGQTLWIPIPVQQFVMPPEAVYDEPPPIVAQPAPAPQQPPAAVVLPVPAPTPPPSSGTTWTKDDVVAAICSLPWDCVKMVAVAACESGLRADAVNPAGYYGIFQIDHAFDGWDNPWKNAEVAYYQKYLPNLNAGGDGLGPWPVCRYAG